MSELHMLPMTCNEVAGWFKISAQANALLIAGLELPAQTTGELLKVFSQR